MSRADVVFVGRAIKMASKDPAAFSCQFDDSGAAARIGCLEVRVTTGLCQPVSNVKVSVAVEGRAEKVLTRYTDSNGLTSICKLRSNRYVVEARTVRGQPAHARTTFDSRIGSLVSIGIVFPDEERTFVTEFKVESVTKGPKLDTVIVETKDNVGGCGFGSFDEKKRYELFVTKDNEGKYVADLCGGTAVMP